MELKINCYSFAKDFEEIPTTPKRIYWKSPNDLDSSERETTLKQP
jgi:hypothetical protein